MSDTQESSSSQRALVLVFVATIVAIVGTVLATTLNSATASIACVVVALILLGFGAFTWAKARTSQK